LEGRSLLPLLHGKHVNWRDAAFSEHDCGFMKARLELGLGPSEARSYMVRTERGNLFSLKVSVRSFLISSMIRASSAISVPIPPMSGCSGG